MNDTNTIQIIITALLSSGLVGGLITLFSKKVWSPEAHNDLAKIGNEFAHTLLEEARAEREELRQTIKDLEASIITKEETVRRLQRLADEKDQVISILEERQFVVARKIQRGEQVSIYDIFGPRAPEEFIKGFLKNQAKENDG